MPLEVTEDEWREHVALAEKLSDRTVAEDLRRLAEREAETIASLDQLMDGYDEIREILLYNMTVLSTASVKLGHGTGTSPKPENLAEKRKRR